MFLRFAYPQVFYIFFPLLLIFIIYKLLIYKTPRYTYPLGDLLSKQNLTTHSYHKYLFFIIRFLLLTSLIFLIARPQWVDERSKVNVNGIDIIIALDVSESMLVFDDLSYKIPRIDIAKKEALRFIDKRSDDPIGLVLFGKDALSRCPLTLDKNMLKELVSAVSIGLINPQGTWLGTGLATAINRLKNSKAKSKIIILLTDGQPTPPEKVEPDLAIEMAKHLGIKVYTIGIGSEKGGFIHHPFFGLQQIEYSLNIGLLEKIAQQTGGQFFHAQKPQDLKNIYNTIDNLEKTEYQTALFHRYYEAFLLFIWVILGLIGLELLLRLWMWRGIF